MTRSDEPGTQHSRYPGRFCVMVIVAASCGIWIAAAGIAEAIRALV